MSQTETKHPVRQTSAGIIYQFPNAAWCRRVSGVFSNQVAREAPNMAHALLVERKDGTFLVSVRAPIAKPQGAEELCIKFSSGGVGMQLQGSTIWLRRRLIVFMMNLIFNFPIN